MKNETNLTRGAVAAAEAIDAEMTSAVGETERPSTERMAQIISDKTGVAELVNQIGSSLDEIESFLGSCDDSWRFSSVRGQIELARAVLAKYKGE